MISLVAILCLFRLAY
jgi:legumain